MTNEIAARKSEGLLERVIDQDIVILGAEGDTLHTLSGVARFIWSLIDGRRGIEEIVSAMTAEYEIDADTARSDLRAFLLELSRKKLIVPSEG